MRMRQDKIGYTLRESQRARRVILKVGANGLEVVVPRRFGKRRLPEIIEANREWIEKELQRIKETPSIIAPEHNNLISIDELWQIDYRPISSSPNYLFYVQYQPSDRHLREGDPPVVRV